MLGLGGLAKLLSTLTSPIVQGRGVSSTLNGTHISQELSDIGYSFNLQCFNMLANTTNRTAFFRATSGEVEEYKNHPIKRVQAFGRLIKEIPDPISHPFLQMDYIKDQSVYHTLAEQGLVPVDCFSFDSERSGRGMVACVFCHSQFTVTREMNPLRQHISQSERRQSGPCQEAMRHVAGYPLEQNPFFQSHLPADSPPAAARVRTGPSGATAGASGHSGNTRGASVNHRSVAHRPPPPELRQHGRLGNENVNVKQHEERDQELNTLEQGIFTFFNKVKFLNREKSREFAQSMLDSNTNPISRTHLLNYLKRLDDRDKTTYNEAIHYRSSMKKVFEAFKDNPSLVAEICTLAGSAGSGCLDRRTEVLERMEVRCALNHLYQLPQGQAMNWTQFLSELKRQFHEEVFNTTFNQFIYHGKSLSAHPESSEIRGFFKHLLRNCCDFSTRGFILAYPGYDCPNVRVFYSVQEQFFSGIENRGAFFDFVKRELTKDYEHAFHFIQSHDESFDECIQIYDSILELEMEELEEKIRSEELDSEEYNTACLQCCTKRTTVHQDSFNSHLQEKVDKNWDALRSATVKGKIASGQSLQALKQLVNRNMSERNGLASGNLLVANHSPLSAQDLASFRAAGVNIYYI